MHYNNNKLIYSPSDIVQFVNSQFASWMNRKLIEEPKSEQPDEDDPQLKILQNKGDLHEKAYLNKLLDAGSDVCEITSGDRLQQTLKAINEGRQIIFQARLEGTGIAGNADVSLHTTTYEQRIHSAFRIALERAVSLGEVDASAPEPASRILVSAMIGALVTNRNKLLGIDEHFTETLMAMLGRWSNSPGVT